jgi:hypothetical protein
MSISVVSFIANYLRPDLPDTTAWSDASLTSWIDSSLLDISRAFPRKSYAMWVAAAATYSYPYADSTTVADETTIIRLLNCLYPYVIADTTGPAMSRKSHLDEDFIGGDFFEPDSDAQILYIGAAMTAGASIYSDAHIYWKTATNSIINPSEHYELIRLFCIWQAYIHQAAAVSSSAVPDSSLLNATALQVGRAETAYRDAYQKLAETKATSIFTDGWTMDKWDRNIHTDGEGPVSW